MIRKTWLFTSGALDTIRPSDKPTLKVYSLYTRHTRKGVKCTKQLILGIKNWDTHLIVGIPYIFSWGGYSGIVENYSKNDRFLP